MGRATGKNNKELGALQLMQGLLGTIGSAGRGLVAGTAGLPGDIESLVRLLPGFSEKTILPTTGEVSGALPKLPAAYRQPVAEGMGQMGAMTPGQVAKLGRVGKAGALALMDRALTPSRVAQAGAVKPRGGNWLESGGLEYLRDLPGETNPEALARMRAMAGPEAGLNQEHLGKWVNGPMMNYVKRDLGTVNDPLLKLADEGISTLPKEQLLNPPFWAKTSARENRKMSGIEQPELGGYAQGWSDLADGMVRPDKAGDVRRNMGSWLEHAKQFEPPEPPWEVSQVYGKQNTKPKDEFLPMIQDFIRSGKYSVGDSAVLENSGLVDMSDIYANDAFTIREINKLKNAGHLDNLPQYMNQQEMAELRGKLEGIQNQGQSPEVTKMIDDLFNGEPQQFAEGGLVEIDDDFSIPGHF